MIAASAMLLVAQAVTPCTTAGTPRLGGGAIVVRPVTSFEPLPFMPLGPATSIRARREGIQQTGAASAQREASEPARQCEPIVSLA